MDNFEFAKQLYHDGKVLLDATRDHAATNDLLRWAREDLEEDLLDLKLAVVEESEFQLPELIFDVLATIAAIDRIIHPPHENEGESQ